MILEKQNFILIDGFGWDNEIYYLCDDTLRDFVYISKGVKKIQIIVSTNRLSKHSLRITAKKDMIFTINIYDIYIDGEICVFEDATHYILLDLVLQYDKIYTTIYYYE